MQSDGSGATHDRQLYGKNADISLRNYFLNCLKESSFFKFYIENFWLRDCDGLDASVMCVEKNNFTIDSPPFSYEGYRSILPMALLGANKSDKRKTNNGIFRLKIVVEKLQRSFTFPRRTSQSFCDSDLMRDSNTTSKYGLREDIKKGHFSVIAIDNGSAKRFVVPLSYLNNPSFLRLLEQAAEEFGFEHEGALCVPCRWNELENILGLNIQF